MFFVPTWIGNIVLLFTCWFAAVQHFRMRRPNPVWNFQFLMMAFCLMMVVVISLFNRKNPWLSMVFCLIAVACLGLTLRQQRMLPAGNND